VVVEADSEVAAVVVRYLRASIAHYYAPTDSFMVQLVVDLRLETSVPHHKFLVRRLARLAPAEEPQSQPNNCML
jgi:hypothetical protein